MLEGSRWHTAALTFAMAAAAIAGAVGPARASAQAFPFGDMPGSYAQLMKMKPMDVMHKMDTDKKGYVTKEEFMKFQEALFEKLDKDKDGQLTRDEWMGKKPGSK
jgi:EF hand domain-containing protein